MARKRAYDALLTECEPYFLDGVHTIGQFAQRMQEIAREAVDRHWDSLVEALGFTIDAIAILNYCEPDKLQKIKPTDGVRVGVKLKVSNVFEAAIYRYWEVEEKATGIEAWTWVNGRARLDQLSKELDAADVFPEPNVPWDSSTSSTGTYFLTRELEEAEIGDLDLRLDEFISYYIGLITKVGGIKKFLPPESN